MVGVGVRVGERVDKDEVVVVRVLLKEGEPRADAVGLDEGLANVEEVSVAVAQPSAEAEGSLLRASLAVGKKEAPELLVGAAKDTKEISVLEVGEVESSKDKVRCGEGDGGMLLLSIEV